MQPHPWPVGTNLSPLGSCSPPTSSQGRWLFIPATNLSAGFIHCGSQWLVAHDGGRSGSMHGKNHCTGGHAINTRARLHEQLRDARPVHSWQQAWTQGWRKVARQRIACTSTCVECVQHTWL
jgi:hypothetical protein